MDLGKFVKNLTDTATSLVGAEIGSFYRNVTNEPGEASTLYSLSALPRQTFPARNVGGFAPCFRSDGVVRSGDITKDARYAENAAFKMKAAADGTPVRDLPVRSYLAVPVISRSGEPLGSLCFGHSLPDRFTERHEALVSVVAIQVALVIDHGRLLEQAQWAQEELKRSNEDLRRANRDLETFSYSASHDLQEPLRNIAINAQLLERTAGGALDAESMRFLQSILHGAHRMEALVHDLLDYTHAIKHEYGAPPTIAAEAPLKEALENLSARIEESAAAVTSTALPLISIHEVHLVQLFQNLIGNAVKYQRGYQPPRVQVSATHQDGWCVFSVADNGIGIDSQYSDQIFELFKRLHSQAEYPGSGVGLAICRRIVEQYGGRIWLEESTPGRGSTFCFALPERPI